MTRLQPTEAPWVHIQALPKNYLLATGEHHSQIMSSRETIRRERITVYMPDHYGWCESTTSDRTDSEVEEDFIGDHCQSCDYYFDDARGECNNGQTDDDGSIIISCRVRSQCPCYDSGLGEVSWPCAADYDEPDWSKGEGDFMMPPMAFAIDLSQKFLSVGDISTWVQMIQQEDDGKWYAGERLRAVNAYDNEQVCWGNDNTVPMSLPEAVITYCDASPNNDLLSISSFKSNAIATRRDPCRNGPIRAAQIPAGYDALLVATAQATPEAFLLLRASGFPATDGLIIAGLTKATHTLTGGKTVPAYLTDPVINGRSWLLIDNPAALDEDGELFDSQGLLLGQIQSTPTQPPCDSPAPSSSEPAALAAC